MADTVTVSSSEFQNRAGQYLERGAGTVVITRFNRPTRVLVDYDEFHQLQKLAKHRPTRRAFGASEMGAEIAAALETADYRHIDPELDKLMD